MANSNFKKFLTNRNFIYLGSLALLVMLVVVFRQFADRHSVQSEISDLNAQAKSLSQKNQDLQNLIQYLKTDDYKQRAARQQLNLQKNGEQVYSFAAQGQPANSQPPSLNPGISLDSTAAQNADISNPQKWWNYFFKK